MGDSSVPALGQPLQAKLTIGEPDDKYEQEADRVAQNVVQRINSLQSEPAPQDETVQRRTDEDELQMKPMLRRQAVLGGGDASSELETSINHAKGTGQPLDLGLQRSMGQAMGADFSGVKVHADAQADQLNRSIQAKAFTTGEDVFFRKGEYNPSSKSGQELIAHELTHVVQQTGSGIQRKEINTKPIQKQPENKTGLPDGLKAGVENLSGMVMDDVKVHYNSSEPAKFQASAYTEGTDIHVASGQEKHLPHEAWHVVQQKQGRVKPSIQLKGISANIDFMLEKEADVMGTKASSLSSVASRLPTTTQVEQSRKLLGQPSKTIQRTLSGKPIRQFNGGCCLSPSQEEPEQGSSAAFLKAAKEGEKGYSDWSGMSCHNGVHFWLWKAGYVKGGEDGYQAAQKVQDYQTKFYVGQKQPVRADGTLTVPAGKIIVMYAYDGSRQNIMHSMVSLSSTQWMGTNNAGTFGVQGPLFPGVVDVSKLGSDPKAHAQWEGDGNILKTPPHGNLLEIVWQDPGTVGDEYLK
ncbi:MAG: DUF4157 domain-containing protein [Cyanobacteria bacterium J06635_15]